MKRKLKITLDIIMLLMTITFFQKNLISLQYHEIAGLILIAVMVLHIAINGKIIRAMCKNFIKIPSEIKVGIFVDALLLICFLWIGLSGILISRTILTGISSNNAIFKLGHMAAGGLSVILLGVHIGLHLCRKPFPTIAAILISVIVFIGGIYGMINSCEVRWLAMPFTIVSQPDGADMRGEKAPSMQRDSDTQNRDFEDFDRQKPSQDDGAPSQRSEGHGTASSSLPQKFENVLMFLFMILSFAMVTYWIVLWKRTWKSRKSTQSTKPAGCNG